MSDQEASENLSSAFAVRGNDALEDQYDTWADSYDADNAAMGFRLPLLGAGFFARWVPKDSGPVLDAGCGTGLAGENLKILGYRDILGIDLSQPMLARAKAAGHYTALHRMVMGEALGFPDNRFAGVISTGVFTEGHAPHSSFDELIRVTKPGGHIVFNVRNDIYEDHGFRDRMDALEVKGLWVMAEKSAPFRPFTNGEDHVVARMFSYRVTG